MRRILVIGPGGAGKSTVARHLGELLHLEVLHLDKFHWRPGWIEPPKSEWLKTVDKLIARDRWIMDGNFSGSLERRVAACDTVIFLDLPRLLCIGRVLKRKLMYRQQTRPDMAAGCPERLNLKFLVWIWNYQRRTKPKIVRLLESKADPKKIVWLRSQAEVDAFLLMQQPS